VPDAASHQKAFENHQSAYAHSVDPHPDWAAVMLFYCAVHLVERLFAIEGRHFCDHSTREFELKSRYMSLWHPYRVLKSESLKTRYLDGGAFTMPPKRVREMLHDQFLQQIIGDVEGRVAARSMIPPPAVP
jgi:hypothetical protein